MDPESFGSLVSFLECFVDVRAQDGGVMPICSGCGADHGEGGAMLLRGDEWLVRCADCLSKEPQDDLRMYTVAEMIALSLTKYGRRASVEPDDGGLARIDILPAETTSGGR